MDKLAASMHSAYLRNKAAVQAVAKKGTHGPVKAKVHATRTKTMVLVFFNSQRMVYTNYVPKGNSVNGNFIAGALRAFLKHLKKMMPEIVEGQWFLHCDNALLHSVKGVQEFLAKKTSNCSSIPPIHLTWPLLTSCSPS